MCSAAELLACFMIDLKVGSLWDRDCLQVCWCNRGSSDILPTKTGNAYNNKEKSLKKKKLTFSGKAVSIVTCVSGSFVTLEQAHVFHSDNETNVSTCKHSVKFSLKNWIHQF